MVLSMWLIESRRRLPLRLDVGHQFPPPDKQQNVLVKKPFVHDTIRQTYTHVALNIDKEM